MHHYYGAQRMESIELIVKESTEEVTFSFCRSYNTLKPIFCRNYKRLKHGHMENVSYYIGLMYWMYVMMFWKRQQPHLLHQKKIKTKKQIN